jgi:hypothetical protein
MRTWLLIAALAAGSTLMKITGPAVAGGRTPPAALTRVIGLLTPALIAALVVSQTFTAGQHLVVDARAAGLAVGAAALWLRAPATVALLLAAVTVALLRLVA